MEPREKAASLPESPGVYLFKANLSMAGGWQLSPIVGAHTSSYYAVTTGVDNALSGIGTQRPNLLQANPYCATRNDSAQIAKPTTGTNSTVASEPARRLIRDSVCSAEPS